MGPVDKVEFEDFHCSPLLTRPKDGNNRRIILDLSYPKGNSVNDNVDKLRFDGHPFALKLPTIDDIVNEITKDDVEKHLFKIDIARAFPNLRVYPADAFKFGIRWKGQYYLDVSVVFGWIHGSAAFQMLSGAITYVMARQSYRIFAYIDDFVAVSTVHQSDRAFQALSHLIHKLGLSMNEGNRKPPCKALTCLGININLTTNVLSIDQDKIQAIYSECVQIKDKKHLTRKAYQSLLGKLLYLHKCVHPARIFVNRILHLFRQNHDKRKISLTSEFFKDIDWFLQFLPHFNGKVLYKNHLPNPLTQCMWIHLLLALGCVEKSSVFLSPIPYIRFPGNHRTLGNVICASGSQGVG